MMDSDFGRLVEIDARIRDLKSTTNSLEKERSSLVQLVKSKGIRHSGDWSFVEKVRTRQTVNVNRLKKTFPNVFEQVAEWKVNLIDLKKSKWLTPDELNSVCEVSISTDYEIVYDPYGKEIED